MADEWTRGANLTLSFRAGDKIRRWSTSDKEFAADIRVSFDDPDGGYFSLVGNQSRDPKLVKAGEASMNLEGFDKSPPKEWKSVVLHEFGHALGFHHEHQHPIDPCDFRMEDDPGYVATTNGAGEFIPDPQGRRPGVYTVLGGPPDNWSKRTVDFNFEELKVLSKMFIASEFDRHSIMLYALPSWMFNAGEASHCYTGRRNMVLSTMDKIMMSKAYPASADEIRKREESARAFKKLKSDTQPANE